MKLPRDVKGSEAVLALCRIGYVVRRQSGSHVILNRGERTVVVPQHKPLKPGTFKGILEQAGVSLEEFIKVL